MKQTHVRAWWWPAIPLPNRRKPIQYHLTDWEESFWLATKYLQELPWRMLLCHHILRLAWKQSEFETMRTFRLENDFQRLKPLPAGLWNIWHDLADQQFVKEGCFWNGLQIPCLVSVEPSVMPPLRRTRLTASAWQEPNWCINCALKRRVVERHEHEAIVDVLSASPSSFALMKG